MNCTVFNSSGCEPKTPWPQSTHSVLVVLPSSGGNAVITCGREGGQKESRGGGEEEEGVAEGKVEQRFCLDGVLADPREF